MQFGICHPNEKVYRFAKVDLEGLLFLKIFEQIFCNNYRDKETANIILGFWSWKCAYSISFRRVHTNSFMCYGMT